MKIRVKRNFRYQASSTEVKDIPPGVYSVPGDVSDELARKILRFGKAELVVEKVAPENKLAEVPDNKAKVVKLPVRRRRSRSKSDK